MSFIEVKNNERGVAGSIVAYIGPFDNLLAAREEQRILVEFNGADYTFRIVDCPAMTVTALSHGVEKRCAECPHTPAPGTVLLHPVHGNPYHYC